MIINNLLGKQHVSPPILPTMTIIIVFCNPLYTSELLLNPDVEVGGHASLCQDSEEIIGVRIRRRCVMDCLILL